MPVFYALLLAHLAADFLQPAALVRWTKQSVNGLFVHTAIYTVLTAIVLAGYGHYWWLWIMVLGFSHFILDHFKYLLGTKLSLSGFYIFVVDQSMHIGIIALLVFGGALAEQPPSPFLALVSDYWQTLPLLAGYVAGTFGASILIFEAGRTFAPQSHNTEPDYGRDGGNAVVVLKGRVTGMIERAVAMTLILAHLYYLVPFSFTVSTYQLFRGRGTNAAKRLKTELAISMLSAIVIGVALIFL